MTFFEIVAALAFFFIGLPLTLAFTFSCWLLLINLWNGRRL